MNRVFATIALTIVACSAIPIASAAQTTTHALAAQSSAEAKGGDFALRSAGGPVRLADFRGKVAVLYFGYTFCPDVCPTALAALAAGLNGLSDSEIAGVQPIFISLDPERDDVARLKEYSGFFHPKIIGATGRIDKLREIARQYQVKFSRYDNGNGTGYVVDHTSSLYVIGKDGRLSAVLPHGSTPTEIVRAIRRSLSS